MAFVPDFINDSEKLVEKKSMILKSILGKKFVSSFVVWDLGENVWFWDGAVVLLFGDVQLELCCNQMEELSITINTIDLSQPPLIAWDPDGNYEWRKNSINELNLVKGETLENVYVVDTEFCSWPEGENYGSPNMNCTWMLNAIDFCFGNGYFKFFNALDENGLTNKKDHKINSRKFNLDGTIEI